MIEELSVRFVGRLCPHRLEAVPVSISILTIIEKIRDIFLHVPGVFRVHKMTSQQTISQLFLTMFQNLLFGAFRCLLVSRYLKHYLHTIIRKWRLQTQF